MRSKLVPLAVSTLGLGLAACGGSGGSSSAGSTHKAAGAGIPGPVHVYRVTLSGAAEPRHGAPSGAGVAIIAFHGSSRICFRFAHLHGFTNATTARIHRGAKGMAGKVVVSLSTAPRLHHEGCVHATPEVTGAIQKAPQKYYVNIHSTQYPSGAVRAQL